MRQNIELEYEETEAREGNLIYIYSHWDGDDKYLTSGLAHKLKNALARHERWDDEGYLARIIISEVLRDSLDDETGYGIQPYEIDPEFPTIKVNFKAQTVDGMRYEDFINSF